MMNFPTTLRVEATVGIYQGRHRLNNYAAVCTCPTGAPGPGDLHSEECAIVLDRVNRLHVPTHTARWRTP